MDDYGPSLKNLKRGDLKASILSPIFNVYTKRLGEVISNHG